MYKTDLLEKIEQHLLDQRISPARFGRVAVRDPRFVFDLRAGRKPRKKMLARVSAFLTKFESDRDAIELRSLAEAVALGACA